MKKRRRWWQEAGPNLDKAVKELREEVEVKVVEEKVETKERKTIGKR